MVCFFCKFYCLIFIDAYNYDDTLEMICNKDEEIRYIKGLSSKVKTFHNIRLPSQIITRVGSTESCYQLTKCSMDAGLQIMRYADT